MRLNLKTTLLATAGAMLMLAQTPAYAAGESKGKFEAGNGTFLLNGEPFVVKAAELHYPRIPRPYWDQRIKLCKALGMNTICLYTFWNSHEPKEDQFDLRDRTTCANSSSSARKTT